MIFQVKDNGKPLTVAYNGGTAFNFVNDPEHFDIYIASQRKMGAAAAAANATILLTNHSEFDNAVTKVKMMAGAQAGRARRRSNSARDAVARYFKVTRGVRATGALEAPEPAGKEVARSAPREYPARGMIMK